MIDAGSAKAVPAVTKAAAALPPPMTVEPGSVVGAPQPQPQGAAPQ
jgi:hypothetical protein